MKTFVSIALILTSVWLVSEAVQVQDGENSFSMESVKVLQHLLDVNLDIQQQNPRLLMTSKSVVCANPTLPQEFLSICQRSGSGMVFSRLASVPVDRCEICAFAACTGC